jgi:Xaa-Pro aminopeptidase
LVTEINGGGARVYATPDNRTAELAEWDDDILAAQLNGLLTDDEELVEAAGFTDKELADLFDKLDESEKDSPSFDEDADVQSGVRMVQLFLDDSNIEEFQSACAKLAEAYQTLNITDTVLEAIRRESSLL